jgi:hypothetical protein
MRVAISDVHNRSTVFCPRKDAIQGELIHSVMESRAASGQFGKLNLWQTPGPGHVARNYNNFKVAVGRGHYNMVEYIEQNYLDMKPEIVELAKKPASFLSLPKLVYGEFFTEILSARKGTVDWMDACFCKTIPGLINDGLFEDLEKFALSNKGSLKTVHFSLTYSIRSGKAKAEKELRRMKALMCKYYRIKQIYSKTYRDDHQHNGNHGGCPMACTAFRFTTKL